jgi:hypothetical protein
MQSFLFNLSAANVPQPLTGANISFNNAHFVGVKSFTSGSPNNNTSTIFLGNVSGAESIPVTSGNRIHLITGPDDFSNWWAVGATSGDGLHIFY